MLLMNIDGSLVDEDWARALYQCLSEQFTSRGTARAMQEIHCEF